MAQTWWLDEQNLAVCALGTVAFQLACFGVAFACRFDLITDLAGSANFVFVALATLLLGGELLDRRTIITSMVVLSRCELGAFLLYRVCKRAKDARFDQMRDSCGAFLVFWIFQMLWVFLCSVPVIIVNGSEFSAAPLGLWDALGMCLFVAGWPIQVCADLQKYRFRSDSRNSDKFCDVGVWRYSRHPNFLGEILLWWGVFSLAVPVLRELGGCYWLALCSPLFTMFILLFVSGLPFAEGAALAKVYKAGRGHQWEEYARTTPPVWLLPLGLYARVPAVARRFLCCEFHFLRFRLASTTAPAGTDEEAGSEADSAEPVEASGSSAAGVSA